MTQYFYLDHSICRKNLCVEKLNSGPYGYGMVAMFEFIVCDKN
jgi:hypothetical protein